MAVSEVWAEINSIMYRMSQTSDGVWSVEGLDIPDDGSYVCAFWATDDVGNTSYRTATLWVFDGKMVCLRFIEDPFQVTEVPSDIRTIYSPSDLKVMHMPSDLKVMHLPSEYCVRFVRVCCT